jgi:glyoxylase-like metal-dependent hydrolase (beta-lactamase superfamily II)
MVSCATPELVVQYQVTGAETNSYLLYDPATREAALVDVGGEIAELLDTVQEQDLEVRYILATHGHTDHVLGVPAAVEALPNAALCMHEHAYADVQTLGDWIREHVPEETLEEWCRDPEVKKLNEFDPATLGKPDLFLKEGDELELGRHTIRVLHCPGHSRGGLCYSVDDILFSGDVLFRGSVGRVDGQNASREDQIESVRRLYREFPDETIVYTGHGEPTTIGYERVSNERVSETAVNL